MTYLKEKYVFGHPTFLWSNLSSESQPPHLCHEDSSVCFMELRWYLHETMCVKCPPWCLTHGRCSIIVGPTPGPWITYSHKQLHPSLLSRVRLVSLGPSPPGTPWLYHQVHSHTWMPYNMHKPWLHVGTWC